MRVEQIISIKRDESIADKALRLVGAGKELSHWEVIVQLDGNVELNNLLKFNTGLKLFVNGINDKIITLSTIRPVKQIPSNLYDCFVRMDYWKYGQTQ